MIVLYGQPKSTQHIYQHVCRGKFPSVYMTNEGKQQKADYQQQAMKQYKGEVLTGELAVTVTFYFQDSRRRDIDNYCKLWQDALNGIVYVDDFQIAEKHVFRKYDKITPRIEIEIKRI